MICAPYVQSCLKYVWFYDMFEIQIRIKCNVNCTGKNSYLSNVAFNLLYKNGTTVIADAIAEPAAMIAEIHAVLEYDQWTPSLSICFLAPFTIQRYRHPNEHSWILSSYITDIFQSLTIYERFEDVIFTGRSRPLWRWSTCWRTPWRR